ncbi:hypothetical protein GLE_5533 [Lysobacter enzymogenes]|uniref:Uncharacterized protein n=1 Tax=Lysobacter enzymogenes TaxID=69 RepID=A0A0S2DQU2_LYSEN|nr:hypothetical protein [Lysobacter enzymogenes]ALN60874.1 hypothetical protein GLE_5533 [Lysobacter enzymogenes]QCW24438.1 hypothetical protein FE772_00885 [Lysobacter enzymogenes]
MTQPTDPLDSLSVSPAAQVIDYVPASAASPPADDMDSMSPYEKLAYLAYVLPARIYAANPWLLDPKYRNYLENL